jgi:stage II sporulation protein D
VNVAVALAAVSIAGAQDWQSAIDRAMVDKDGVALVGEVSTGRILARHGDADRRATPGSIVKPFVLASILETAPVRPLGDYVCPGRLRIGARVLDCSHPVIAGAMSPVNALAYSCNNWFARMASRVEPVALERALLRFSPGGDVRRAADDDALRLQALGEEGFIVSPSEVLAAYRRLALARLRSEVGLRPVFDGLDGAAIFGTARLGRPPGVRVSGKTGTTSTPDRRSTRAWFAGWAPAEKPEIVAVVFLDQGRGGGDAAPVAREVFARLRPAPQSPASPAAPPAAVRPREVAVRLYWRNPPRTDTLNRKLARGRLVVRGSAGRFRYTLHMKTEDYVAAVIAGEAANFQSDEALKAMAVVIRSYAARNMGRHRPEGFDFCDTTHCQDVRLAAVTDRLRAAAEATESEILWYDGRPANTFHHQHCGGVTEAAADVWPDQRAPYLKSLADSFCIARERFEWRARVTAAALKRAFSATPQELAILERTGSGRVARIRAGTRVLAPERLREALGWDQVRSAWFEVRPDGDGLVFEGHGSGHGVGLCQIGAARRGEQGHDYRDILAFYYPGTALGVGAAGFAWTKLGGELVDVVTTREAEDRALVEVADRLAREAERRAGWPIGFRPRLKLYPSVAAFRDATAEPGWVAASVEGRTIRMQPAAVLRARGRLESTLLHEFLHVALDDRAHSSTPEWFREGLALHLAQPETPAAAQATPFKTPRTERETRAQYAAWRSRVKILDNGHGREQLLRWWREGLPAYLRTPIFSRGQ